MFKVIRPDKVTKDTTSLKVPSIGRWVINRGERKRLESRNYNVSYTTILRIRISRDILELHKRVLPLGPRSFLPDLGESDRPLPQE